METSSTVQSLKRIADELNQISEELSRPDEDVVTISVCHGARTAIYNLMHIFLQEKSNPAGADSSLDEMLDACIKISNAFSGVDLGNVVCRDMSTQQCEGKYCMSVERVHDCVNVAKQLKGIVLTQLAINESELN